MAMNLASSIKGEEFINKLRDYPASEEGLCSMELVTTL
jgi:hypothetical protein